MLEDYYYMDDSGRICINVDNIIKDYDLCLDIDENGFEVNGYICFFE